MADDIQDKVWRVQERIGMSCQRAGRRTDEVRLIAVGKTFPAAVIHEAYNAGLRDFGENRIQEAAAKRPALADLDITWHLVGHLQTNKAKRARDLFHWLHSVDSVHLADKLDKAPSAGAEPLPILLEVNLGGEEAKSGLAEYELLKAAEAIEQYPSLDLRGLMAIPPFSENPEDARPFFRRLRELAEQIRAAGVAGVDELSMGMSHDFEVAIEEGATMIRLGTAIFGPR